MLDAERYPAAEITLLYHQRWGLETGFDELHTHTLERLEALRSQTPDRIRQELFALAVVYNLVRLEMARVAGHLEVIRIPSNSRTVGKAPPARPSPGARTSSYSLRSD